MKTKMKRILVLLMAAVMLISSSNVQAFAAEQEEDSNTIVSEESVIIPEEYELDAPADEEEAVEEVQEEREEAAEEEIAADEIEPVQESDVSEESTELSDEEAASEQPEEKSEEQAETSETEESVVQDSQPSEEESEVDTETEEPEESDMEPEKDPVTDEESQESEESKMDPEISKETDEETSEESSEEADKDEQNPEESETEEDPEEIQESESESDIEQEASEEAEKEDVKESEVTEDSGDTAPETEIPEENEQAEEEEPAEAEETAEEETPLEDVVIVQNPFVPLEAFYAFSLGGQMGYPLTQEAVITAMFGETDELHESPHTGIDLAVDAGSPVIAARAGLIVTTHMWDGTVSDSYGNYVDIRHENGMITRYGHLSEINIQEGDEVEEGQQIGRVGSTGRSTGPHLHYEVIQDGEEIDPYPLLYPLKMVIDLNYAFGTIHAVTKDEEYRIYQETAALMYRDSETGESVPAEDGHVLVLKDPGMLMIDAYDAFGYAISVTAFDSEGMMVEISRDKEGYFHIPTDGSVSRVLAGSEIRMMLRGGTNAVYTDGMDLNSNAVLRFAKAVGFDVDSYLSSSYAWKAVDGNADGLYDTAEGQAMMSGSLPYTDGGAIGSGTPNEVWPGINLWIGAGNWDELNTYLHSGGYPGVQCAGLVNAFFGYIYQNLYSDADWKAYYDAYSYGTKNDLSGTFDSWNNVGSVEAGLEGLNQYKEANGYYVQVCDNYSMTHDDFVAMLDEMAPGAVIRFSNNQAGIYDGNGNYRLQHAGIYIGKAGGLHWMFHTNTYDMKARIVPLEYYSMSFNNGSEDPHKGKVWITRAGGMETLDKTGSLEIVKNSSNPSLVSGNTNYSLSGAVYAVYKDGTEVGRLTTDANGKTSTLELEAGTYTIKEITAPKGYKLDTTVYSVEVKPGEKNSKGVYDEPDTGYLYLKKESSNTSVTEGNSNYSPVGAEFTVYTDANCTKVVSGAVDKDTGAAITKLTVKDANGNTNTMQLPVAGTYYVKETKAPTNGSYKINTQIVKVTVSVGKTEKVTFKDEPYTTEIKLTKASANTDITEGNSCYSLKGTEYTIYRTRAGNTLSDPWPVKIVIQDEKGNANTVTDLPAGTYYVKETKAGKGYLMDSNIYTVTLKPGDSKTLTMKDEPMTDPNVIQILKRNGTGGENDLAGAQFKFEFYDAYYDSITEARKHTPTRTWTFETKKDSKGRFMTMYSPDYLVSGDELYKFGNAYGLPLGTIIISETKAAPGYNNDPVFTNKASTANYGSTYFGQIKASGTVGALYTGNTKLQEDGFEVTDTPVRGNFTIKKTTSNGQAFAGVSFRITMLDENGSKKTGSAYTATFKTGADGTFTSNGGNLWIGTDIRDSSKGSLPYGSYIIEEISDDVNVGYEVIAPKRISITVNGKTVDAGTFKNYKPEITTLLKAGNGLKIEEAKAGVTLTDTITYKDLDNYLGKTVTIKGEIRKMDGTLVTSKSITLKVENGSGSIQNSFTFDASDLAGQTVVCYEYVTFDGKTVCAHADKNDAAQQIRFPKIGTTAKDNQTGDHLMLAAENAVIIDTVSYSNLIPGASYTVEGKLMDKTTGKALLVDGKEVISTATFKAENVSGTVDMKFTFDASGLKGYSLVVFEQIKVQGQLIGRHEEISDEGQTIHIPDGGTTATDSETNDHVALADKEVTIKDQVHYENLLPGKEYTVTGKLMDRATGKALLVDGKEVTASKTFTASKADGSVEITFTFDGSLLQEKTVVVFETLQYRGKDVFVHADLNDTDQTVRFPEIGTEAFDTKTEDHLMLAEQAGIVIDRVTFKNLLPEKEYRMKAELMDAETGEKLGISSEVKLVPEVSGGTVNVEIAVDARKLAGRTIVIFEQCLFGDKVIAVHEDLTDEKQAVHVPEIGTMAVDARTEDHIALAEEKMELIDTVSYSNLIPGKEYTVSGKLMDKDTGNALLVNGREVTSTVTFKAEKPDGEIGMKFIFDGSELKGKTLVVFEEVTYKGKLVAVHADINDEGQTVHIPDGGTTATDSKTDDHIAFADKEVTIKDQVHYENLLPGKEYTVIGTLMEKATGKPLLVDGKEVTVSKTFTADKADGSVEIAFTFDGSLLEDKTVVAFETIQYNGKDVFIHADLEDDDQTVHFPKIRTTAEDSITGSELANCAGPVTLIDTVSYSNVIPGRTYILKAVLMDRETNSPIIIGDQKITGTATFTAENEAGTADVKISFNAASLQGRDLVFFEELYLKDEIIAEHKDIEDKDQTIKVPDIRTLAKDEHGNKTIPDHGQVTVIDEVQYKNLVVGRKYRLRCVIMLRSTGEEAVTQDQYIIDEKVFTPENSNGTTEIRAIIPVAEDFVGEAMVVYEYLTWNDLRIAIHTDIEDEGQTVRVPVIRTTALDSQTEDHITLASENAVIIDTVSYQNVTPNEAFTLIGTLMHKETGKPVLDKEGTPVTASALVIPEKENGSVEIEFRFDARELAGTDVVVFEEMYVSDTLVTSHADLTDEGQTIHIPDGGTTATDWGTNDHLARISEVTKVVDKVTFNNLPPGKEYTVIGVLMDKDTGEPLLIEGQEVTARKTFTADQKDGEIQIEFTFDSRLLAGKSIVAFETVQYKGKDVFIHADLNDDDQTVRFPWIGTEAFDTRTGDHLMLAEQAGAVIDRVTFRNLQPGKEYRMKAELMDAETGEKLGISSEVKLVPEASDGTIDVEIAVDARKLAGRTFVIFEQCLLEDEVIAVHEDLTDEKQTVHVPEIGTVAKDAKTEDHIALAQEKMELIDTVSYSNLIPGKEYTVSGKLMDKSTGESLLVDGKEVTSAIVFTPEEADGEIEMKFIFDGAELKGKTLVVFEEITYKGIQVAVHADINDEGQTVHIPDGGTTATDFETDDHIAFADQEVTIKDQVRYENLLPGKEYTVNGKLMDKATGNPLLINGKEVTVSKTFTADKADGSVEIVFTFDGTLLENTTIVAFETIQYNGKDVFIHADLNDEDQTVRFPWIGTEAFDTKTEDHLMLAEQAGVVIDHVTFKNLLSGKEYRMKAELMDAETGEKLGISNEVKLVPEASDGTIDVEIAVDARKLAGRTFVIFEQCLLEDEVIAIHEDLIDEKQTIHVPEIGTAAKDAKTEDHIALAEEKMELIDTVSYCNLIPGKEYTVSGKLMDKDTGKALLVDGKEVTSARVFTPEKADGEIEMKFIFDGSGLKGKTLVVFEEVSYMGILVAVHADINDEGQTVHIPGGETHAADKATGNHLAKAGEITVTDKVEYRNLLIGKKYTVRGTLYIRETGEKLIDAKGNPVTAETEFVAEKADGNVELKFTFDGTLLEGQTVVAFEEVKYGEYTVFVHADLEDEEQSVHIPRIGTTARDGKNGTNMVLAEEDIQLVDTVSYENLIPDQEYILKGMIVEKETGKQLEGSEIVQMTFIPETSSGSVDMIFDLKGEGLDGKTLVIYEKLYLNKDEIASHEDLEDEGQTVYVPEVKTTAEDAKTGNHTSLAEEKVKIKDIVQYRNLIPGKKYTVIGTLIDKDTGEMLMISGKPVMSSVTFTAEKPDGEIEMIFELDGSALEGKTVVVFEDIFYEDVRVGSHADLSDEDQSIQFPEVKTQATVNGQKRVDVNTGLVTLIDTVSYKNLTPGVEYTLEARLFDRQTGKPAMLNGKEITAEVKFTPDQPDGTAYVQLQFNTEDYPEHDLVVFETVIQTDIQKIVGQHEDLYDADQTIRVTRHPQTGDAGNTAGWIIVLVISLGLLVWSIWMSRREQMKQ